MVSSPFRLSRKDFPQFLKTGHRFHSTHFTLVYTLRDTLKASVVVSKKVAKNAVDRNRLRRRAYGVIERLHKTESRTGVFIVMYKSGALTASRLSLQTELEALLAQIRKAR